MSFLRHQQIFRSDVLSCFAEGETVTGFALGIIVSMSLRPVIPWRVALLHCSPPLHQPNAMVNRITGNRQPPLGRGWGNFNRRNGEFSSGVDSVAALHNCAKKMTSGTVFETRAVESRILGIVPIGSANNPVEFVMVEPVEFTRFASVDDDVTGPEIRMGVHWSVALRTSDASVQIARIGT